MKEQLLHKYFDSKLSLEILARQLGIRKDNCSKEELFMWIMNNASYSEIKAQACYYKH